MDKIMEAKKLAIEKAYIDLIGEENYQSEKENINEDGWCTNWNHFRSDETRYADKENFDSCGIGWRPKSLEGIDDNNGWIRIEKIEDLPEIYPHSDLLYHASSDEYYYKNLFTATSLRNEYLRFGLTHYKPLVEPQKHVY